MGKKPKDTHYTNTSVRQPRELWNKLRNDAVNQQKGVDDILTNILKEYYSGREKS